MEHTVWLDEWQWACCGEPFSVGATVRWHLEEISADDWVTRKLASLLSAEVADQVTHREDHHGMHTGGEETSGVIRRITAVFARYEPTGERTGPQRAVVYADMPGSGVLEQRRTSRPIGRRSTAAEPGELEHVGWLVDLEVADGEPGRSVRALPGR